MKREAIISRIESISNYASSLKQNLYKLHSIKTGLMQDLLSGKVRVNQIINETVMNEA